MVSKNNHQVYQQKLAERKQRWGIRKLSVGVASVLLGTTFMLYSNHAVLADTVPNTSESTQGGQGGNAVAEGTPSTLNSGETGNGQDETETPNNQPSNQNENQPKEVTTDEKTDQNVIRNASADYTPATPTTDKAGVTTGVYNNPLVTSSDWIKMTHGDAVGYYTAKGKDGKTYVTGYAAAKGNSQSIFNVDQIDANSLEFHLIYHNGDKEVGSGLWFNFADGKTLQLDTSRLGADGPQLKSQQG